MLSSKPLVETEPSGHGEPVSSQPQAEGEPHATGHSLSRWIWDGLVLAYFLSGGVAYDPRLGWLPGFSFNQLLAVLVLGRLGWVLWHRPRWKPRALATLLAAAALTTVLTYRGLGSPNAEYARFKILGYALLVLPVLVYFDRSVRCRADLWRLLKLWVLAAGTLTLLAIPAVLRIGEGQRLAVLAGGPNVFARIVGCGVLCSLFLWVHWKHSWRESRFWALLLWLPWAGISLLLSGSKAVLTSLFLSVSVALMYWGNRRTAWTILFVLLALVSTPLWTHRLVADRPKDGGLVRLLRLPDVDDPLGSFGSRLGYIETTWRTLRDTPWLGVGTGAWGIRTGNGDRESYPHNLCLEIVAELGLLGLLLTGLPFLGWPRRPCWKNRRDKLLSSSLLGLVMFWGVNVQLSGDLVDSRYLWLFLLLLEGQRRLPGSTGEQEGGFWKPFWVWSRSGQLSGHTSPLESNVPSRHTR